MSNIKPIINETQNQELIYSPTTLLGVFSSAIKSSVDARIILARGIYQDARGKDYSGYFYDNLKSPNSQEHIKIKVPNAIKHRLEDNLIYVFRGYVEKRISFSSIELVLVVDEMLEKEKSQITAEEIRRFESIKLKVSKGYRDLESFIKQNIYSELTTYIVNVYGNSAIVNKDFELGISETISRFKISDYRCSFTSKTELINLIKNIRNLNCDIIAFVRGGGAASDFAIFDDADVAHELIGIKPFIVTALGHVVDEVLLDKIADKKFALPHDYGIGLKVWVEQALENQSKSKSVFIDQVKKDLSKTYTEQIIAIQKQLDVRNKEFESAQIKFKEMFETSQKEKNIVIQAKEKEFEAGIKSLSEQIKAKDESLKLIQQNFEKTLKEKETYLIENYKTKIDNLNNEIKILKSNLASKDTSGSSIVIFIIIIIIAIVFVIFLSN